MTGEPPWPAKVSELSILYLVDGQTRENKGNHYRDGGLDKGS